jgi:hypothetical protein
MTPTFIRIEPDAMARLRAVADATGHSVASVIRFCIDKQLPALEVKFTHSAQLKGTSPSVPSSTIDGKAGQE